MPLTLVFNDETRSHVHYLPIDVVRPWQIKDSLLAAVAEHDEASVWSGKELIGHCIAGQEPQVKCRGKWNWE